LTNSSMTAMLAATAKQLETSYDEFPSDEDVVAELAQLSNLVDYCEQSSVPRSSSLMASASDSNSVIRPCSETFDESFLSSMHTVTCGQQAHSFHTSIQNAKEAMVGYEDNLMAERLPVAAFAPQQHRSQGAKSQGPEYKRVLHSDPGDTSWREKVDEYSPLEPFARPNFPARVRDRSPTPGLSSNLILRTCFRIGEVIKVGSACDALVQETIVELFARVTKSLREINTTKQRFEFADLFHDRPPFINGTLENFKVCALQETESSRLSGEGSPGKMVRCIGRIKRDLTRKCWMLHVINIRATDWEEVRHTKRIAGAGKIK
jgi:hypothetical protein